MIWKLIATVTHKQFDRPVIHEFFYKGETLKDVLDQIDTLPQHLYNLKKHGRTAFKDQKGVKHSWTLNKVDDSAH